MGNLGDIIANFISMLFFIYLAVVFSKHTRKSKRPLNSFRWFFLVGVLYSLFVVIYYLIPDEYLWAKLLIYNVYLTLSGIQMLLFFEFIHSVYYKKISRCVWIAVYGLIMMQQIGLWADIIVGHLQTDLTVLNPLEKYLKFFQIFGYNICGVLVFAIIGGGLYWKTFRYTHEKKALGLFIALAFGGFGYLLTTVSNTTVLFLGKTDFLTHIKNVGDTIPVIGVFFYFLVLVIDPDYIFRLPLDHHFMFIIHNSGLKIYRINFNSKNRRLDLKEYLFAGMISALDALYQNVLDSSFSIKQIESEGISLYIERGEIVTCVIATDYVTPILRDGMKQFVAEFEATYQDSLKSALHVLDAFQNANEIFLKIFPFVEILEEVQEK